jgi:hypothetical protein
LVFSDRTRVTVAEPAATFSVPLLLPPPLPLPLPALYRFGLGGPEVWIDPDGEKDVRVGSWAAVLQ